MEVEYNTKDKEISLVPHEVLHLDIVGDAINEVFGHFIYGILRVKGESRAKCVCGQPGLRIGGEPKHYVTQKYFI